MASNLAVALFVLAAYVTATAVVPTVCAAKSPASTTTTTKHEAAKEADAPAKAPAAAGGSGAPMTWPDGGPEFVEMVIKNPFFKSTPPPGSDDGLPIDPTPEGSMS